MVSWQHVAALNRIDLEFTGPEDKPVMEAWEAFMDFLRTVKMKTPDNPDGVSEQEWALRRDEKEIDLLHKMATVLHYQFEKTDLKTLAYHPQLHADIDLFGQEMRVALRELMTGKRGIPIYPMNPPAQQSRQPAKGQGTNTEQGEGGR